MLIVLVTSILASIAFGREAGRRQCDRGRVMRLPLVIGGLVIGVGWMTGLLMSAVFARVGTSETLAKALLWGGDIFFAVMFFVVVTRNWRALQRIPEKPAESDIPIGSA